VDGLVRKALRMGPLAELLIRHPSYDSLVDIVPGVREMALFHELAKVRDAGRFDRVVLDAPATGHGIHFLEAPDKTARILAGPLRERAEQLRDMLKDPAVTDLVIVTLAEETPVRETVELAGRLEAQGFTVDNVVVNRWLPRAFEDAASRRALAALPTDDPWAAAMRLVLAQREEGDAHLAQLRALDAKLAVVPLIPDSSRRLLLVAQAMHDLAPGAGA
jgi:anion-transporting  ArsA/GET3 family ATPase